MAAEQQLERSVLERKEREELRAIADAMALDTNSRSKKADIIDQILRAAGVDAKGADGANGSGTPARPRSRAGSARAAANVDAELTPSDATTTNGDSAEHSHANGVAPASAASNGQSEAPEGSSASDETASAAESQVGGSEGATVTQADRPAPARPGGPGPGGPGQNR